jgi:hypothetical protein
MDQMDGSTKSQSDKTRIKSATISQVFKSMKNAWGFVKHKTFVKSFKMWG